MRSINDDILYGIDNSINNEKVKHRIKQEIEKLDYEKQYYIKEIERLNNIINKLEEVLNENVELTYVHYGIRQYNKTLTEGGLLFRDYIKSKLQELKGSDKE